MEGLSKRAYRHDGRYGVVPECQEPRMAAAIEVEHVAKRFGTTVALDDVSLEVESGKVLALLGPPRRGRTTLVRVLTTLLQLDRQPCIEKG